MKHLTQSVLSALVLLSVALQARGAEQPAEVVRKLTDEVIAVLKGETASSGEKRNRVKAIVLAYADLETMSRLVLARNWKTISDDKQREFVEEFKKHLAATYGHSVDAYRDEKVSVTGDRKEARGDWTVKTKIVRGGPNDILVDYRLRKVESEWKIIDLIIERISLVSNFRSQFQGIILSRGVDGVLEELRRKNEKRGSGLKES